MSCVFADVIVTYSFLVCEYMELSSWFLIVCGILTHQVSLRCLYGYIIRRLPFPSNTFISSECSNSLSTISEIYQTIHCWNLLWQVEPELYSFESTFHWHLVLNTCIIPSITFLNGTIGGPTVLFDFSDGSSSFDLMP